MLMAHFEQALTINNLRNVKFPLNLITESHCTMKTISITLPELSGLSEFDVKIILAGELYVRERLSLGQAADVAGLSKRSFIEIIGKYGFSIFSESLDDFRLDLENAWKA